MTNKLVVIINSLKVPKIKKILLYEMKFLVPNYSCLQSPWLGGYRPQIPVLFFLCPQLNLLNPPSPRTKFLGTPLLRTDIFIRRVCAILRLDPALRNSKLVELMNSAPQNDLALVKFWTPCRYNMVAMNGLHHVSTAANGGSAAT